MCEDRPFDLPVITDDDIRAVTRLLQLPANAFSGEGGSDARQGVIRSMQSIDVAACPGSGKTTLLVAKLAALATKWQCRTRGICVLSHTNVARREIETRLGHTSVGRRLLAYPHYVGTIHGFVDEFFALPWLRSRGHQIKLINTEICLERRWNALPPQIRSGLERTYNTRAVLCIKSPDFSLGEVHWSNGVLGTGTSTYRAMQDVCRQSATEGYFCYDEMLMWAEDLIKNVPAVTQIVRDRFPLLFIDEAQDNSEDQSAILHRVFMDGGTAVVRQRFGDNNQAIFDFMGDNEEVVTDRFPIDSIRQDLPNSHRFGQKIANLADPLGVARYPCGLRGQGPKRPLASGTPDTPHTIFLFSQDSLDKVLDAYGELLTETFSDEELATGDFTAVGQIHRDSGLGDRGKPRHVGHYWHGYDAELSGSEPKPKSFVQYVFAGLGRSRATGEACSIIEKIAEGVLRLAQMASGSTVCLHPKHSHQLVRKSLEEHPSLWQSYEDLVTTLALERQVLTQDTWNKRWCDVVRNIAGVIAGGPPVGPAATAFLEWTEGADDSASLASLHRSRDNVYRFSKNGKVVAIRIGSVHSVKGESHTATLVLETFWYDHNLESIREWICDYPKKPTKCGRRIQNRLRIHYVAMTRPSHLLCLAMKRSSFENSEGTLRKDLLAGMEERGWQMQVI